MKKRMKKAHRHLLHDMPINTKILVSILVCVFLPFFCGNIFSYAKIDQSIRTNLQEQVDHSVNIAAEKLKRQFSEAIALGDILMVDKGLLSSLQKDYPSDMDYYLAYVETIRPRLDQYALLYPHYTSIQLYTDNPTLLSGGGVYDSQAEKQFDKEVKVWYNQYQKTDRDIALIVYPTAKETQLSMVYRLSKSGNPHEVLLKVDFSTELIHSMLMVNMENMRLALTDENGEEILSSSTQAEPSAVADNLSVQAFVTLDERLKCQLQGVIQETEMLSSTMQARWLLVLLMLFGVGGTVALYRIMYKSYIKRINQLLAHMKLVRAQQFVTIEENEIGSDEIGQLMHGFNDMTGEISRLINDIYILAEDKKNLEIENMRAELLNMQSQMDPHFMYNTLSAMMVVSMKENYPKLVDIIYYLSRLLRRMVDRTDNYVSIHEEIVFTEMYLRIESFRFQAQFSYEIDVQPEARDWAIPKFSIQPLVENSCRHGIHARSRAGWVKVRVYEADGYLWITVRDNGSGLTPQQLAETRQAMMDPQQVTKSVGLHNIYMRLYYEFRDSFSMEISSVENVETQVQIRLPLERLKKCEEEMEIPLEPGGGIPR